MVVLSNRKYCFLLFLVTTIFESSESQYDACASQLANQIVHDGQPADFTSADTTDCQWYYTASSDEFGGLNVITDTSGNLISPYDQFYSVSSTDLGINTATGDRIIDNPNSQSSPDSTAGIYVLLCPSCATAANLITVYNNGSTCSCDPSAEVVTCSITYAASTLQPSYPIITWIDSSANPYSPDQPTPVKDTYTYTSTSQLPITGVGASEYTCLVTFSAPDPFPVGFMATNAPTFTTSCSVEQCLDTK